MKGATWAVIMTTGELRWYRAQSTDQVKAMVSGEYAPGALTTATVTLYGPLRVLASDIALTVPEHYPANPLATLVIRELSDGRITQPWRGHVALVEYERDRGPGSIGEWLGPCEMSDLWRDMVTRWVGRFGRDI